MAATLGSWRGYRPSFALVEDHGWIEAIRTVIDDPRCYAFRCNREVVDVAGRFRSFSWRGGRYVLKRAASQQAGERERALAVQAAARLAAAHATLRAIVPELLVIDVRGAWLASPYLGPSLHESFVERRLRWEPADVVRVLGEMRRAGLEWAGFAPRNLIACDNGLFGIDWEDLRIDIPHSGGWSDLTLFKLALNWAGVFGSADCAHAVLASQQRTWRSVALDDFEQSWRGLRGGRDDDAAARRACRAICFESEQPVVDQPSDLLSAQEVGHLVSDLLGSPLDVFYAAVTARHRRDDQDGARCVAFLRDMTRRVDAALRLADHCQRGQDRTLVCETMTRSIGLLAGAWPTRAPDGLAGASCRLHHLRGRRGLASALLRAKLVEEVATVLWRSARDLFAWEVDLQFLLRGSVANGVCSVDSDLDFEISSPERPNGFPEAEDLLGALLDGFGIRSENSTGRPTERDIIHAGGSRDVLEWLELRDLDGGHTPWPHACGGRNRPENVILGGFEREARRMDGKHLWLAVRGTIARASAARGCGQARTMAQLEWLRCVAGMDIVPLRSLLGQALAARELHLADVAIEPLSRVAACLDVPVPLWAPGEPGPVRPYLRDRDFGS